MILSVTFHPQNMKVSVGNPIVKEYIEVQAYMGEYDVVPSAEEQVLETAGKRMLRDVVVAPIPNNYGLITWNGTALTVS